MLIYKDDDGRWYGLLNDWELSKKIDGGFLESRQPDRTVSANMNLLSVLSADIAPSRVPGNTCLPMPLTIHTGGLSSKTSSSRFSTSCSTTPFASFLILSTTTALGDFCKNTLTVIRQGLTGGTYAARKSLMRW